MKEFEKFEEMFAQSIGLEDPWHIEKAEFEEKSREVHIYVTCRKTAQYQCPECGDQHKRYDNEEERIWQHGDVVFFPCYIHCRRPRVKCDKTGGTHVVTAPWARKGSRYTLLFEAYSMLLAEKLPIEQARKFVRISHTSFTNIVSYWVDKAVREDDLSVVETLSIDETSFKKGQSYVTVIDKFHVKKLMLDAMDKVRREEQGKEWKQRKMGRKLLMIPETRMNEQQHMKMLELSKKYPKTGRAFRMVQSLDVVYAGRDVDEGRAAFDRLISWLKRSRLQPMKDVAKTLLRYKKEILEYFTARLTNAIAEGINSLIQTGKRKARGFRTFRGYRTMIYLTCSKLNFAPIPLFG